MTSAYPDTLLFIGGAWQPAASGKTLAVENPATAEQIGTCAHAGIADLDAALDAAEAGFRVWRKTPAPYRSATLRSAAALLRERADTIGSILTQEQGKPLAQGVIEVHTAADILEWFAEEARRIYGRAIPGRSSRVVQRVEKEPVGVVAAFSPWNFPISQAIRKVGAAVAAGCAIVIKGPEETPASCAEMVRALADAGLPAGVVNLVFGSPAEISGYLIPHPIVRKVTFTGSTQVGKQLASLAGLHMKRVTMELGGHAPVLVFADADLEANAKMLAQNKVRNAGQVCVSPTRFLVQDEAYDRFVGHFTNEMAQIRVGNGLDDGIEMGALANGRRVEAVEAMVADAVRHGATLRTGGERIGNKGHFFQPTVLTDVPIEARAMNEEPFGPVALFSRFATFDDAIIEANRLPFGLGAYVYSGSLSTANRAAAAIESGMVSVNHQGLGLIETPFGGVKDSGYGSEGGSEAIEAYFATKFVTTLG
jgi:succinate-semialdehyde dehydrogenase/glutarate-semialdehyde dehydrogenase